MKQKIAKVLCMTMCIGLLFGCGKKETDKTPETVVEVTGNEDATGILQRENKQLTVSEYLGGEKRILYRIYNSGIPMPLDKEKIPSAIYFVDGGTVIYVDGQDFGFTMGELSRMEDVDIWAKMEEYNKNRYSNITDEVHQLGELKAGIMYMEYSDKDEEISDFAMEMLDDAHATGSLPELPAYTTYPADELTQELWEEWADTYPGGLEKVKEIGEEVREQMEACLSEMVDCCSVAFIVETDATGNNVQDEAVVFMRDDRFYKIVLEKKGGTGQIYDSSYDWYPCDSSDVICVRDNVEMIFDEIGDDNVYVDIEIGYNDVKELFESIIPQD